MLASGTQSGFSASTTIQVQSNLPWSSFGYDAQHDRSNPHEDTLSPANVATLAPLWNVIPGSRISSSSSAVVKGVLYIGSMDGTLYALNATTGKQIWRYATDNALFSSPTVVNGTVYIGSYSGQVYAFGLPGA